MLTLVAGLLAGCDVQPSADQIAHEKQEAVEQEGQRQAGLPAIHNFYEKKMLKTILELRDDQR